MSKFTAHYTDSIHYELEKTAKLMKLLSMQLFMKIGIDLSLDEYITMDTISCTTEICQRDLAKLIIRDRANTGRILNSLEEKKLVTRFVDTKNNRLVRKMSLTEEGQKKLKSLNKRIEDYLLQVTNNFPKEEVENVRMSLKKLRQELEPLVNINI